MLDRDSKKLEVLKADLPESPLGKHLAIDIDLTDSKKIYELVRQVPQLDAIINNAGMSSPSGLPLVSQNNVDLERVLALNLHAPAHLVEALSSKLTAGARIVNVASGAGMHAVPWRGAYSPSKAGLIAQTQALAIERPDLCVNVLCPGFVRTALVEGLINSGRLDFGKAVAKIPLGRMAEPDEIARALCFLATPGAAPISGSAIVIDGGSSSYGGVAELERASGNKPPLDTPLNLSIFGAEGDWNLLNRSCEADLSYDACLDVTPLYAHSGMLQQTVLSAATRFFSRHKKNSSLTLLLPHDDDFSWKEIADSRAAQMMVTTLACEWGSYALRINALIVNRNISPRHVYPLVEFVSGAQAQFMTGQNLVLRNN